MARLYFLIAAAAFVAVAFAKPEPIGFEIVNDIKKFGAENPSIKLEPLVIDSATFNYILGARQDGDRPINNGEYNSGKGCCPKDYKTELSYPPQAGGVGSHVITFGDITVEQTSAINNVYVSSGGIGQKHISIVIEAKNTTYLEVKGTFYGL